MAKSIFQNVAIRGIATCIPENYKMIDDEVDTLYHGDIKQVERIKKSIGLNKRHIVKGNTTTADLCETAAAKLLNEMDILKDEIDALIFVSQTPDYFQPATAAYLQGKLNLSENCAIFDVNQGCAGYIYGLWLAHMMIETRSCRHVLLLAGDTISKTVNPNDSNVAPLFGDAGSATLLSASENKSEAYFALHANGKKFDTIIIPSGSFRKADPKIINNQKVFELSEHRTLKDLYMDGGEVFNFSLRVGPQTVEEVLVMASQSLDDIDYIIFHQANQYIIKNVVRRLRFPIEKAPSETTGKYGNQSSASIPSTICDALKDRVINEKLKIVFSGFGVGLSWASCLVNLDHIYCSDIIYFKEE